MRIVEKAGQRRGTAQAAAARVADFHTGGIGWAEQAIGLPHHIRGNKKHCPLGTRVALLPGSKQSMVGKPHGQENSVKKAVMAVKIIDQGFDAAVDDSPSGQQPVSMDAGHVLSSGDMEKPLYGTALRLGSYRRASWPGNGNVLPPAL